MEMSLQLSHLRRVLSQCLGFIDYKVRKGSNLRAFIIPGFWCIYLEICKCLHLRMVNHLEKEMAPHSSIRAWKIPWTEEPGGL